MALRAAQGKPPDITVILGHRNRADYRLINALRSIASQRNLPGRVRTLIIDYGSDPEDLTRLREIVKDFGVECHESPGGPWRRGHCLNLGLRRVESTYVLVSDVDVILAENFLAETVAQLERDPLTVVFGQMYWLPESEMPGLQSAAAEGRAVDAAALKSLGVVRIRPYNTGLVAGRTCYFHALRGYDEFYQLYGAEDDDLAARLQNLGLRHVDISDRTFYLHQWHPRREGVKGDALAEAVQRNKDYFKATRSLVRNLAGWGDQTPSAPA